MTRADISEAIHLLMTYNEQVFSVRGDFQRIHMWLTEGCDMLKDILPAMREMMARNKRITSVAYFSPLVLRNRDNRMDREKASTFNPIIQTDKIDPFTKARLYAWKRAKKMYLNGPEEAYLRSYESQYGMIKI